MPETLSKQQVVFGPGSLSRLPQLLEQYAFDSIFLVSGQNSFQQPSVQQHVPPLLTTVPSVRFFEFEKNPKLEDVEAGVALYQTLKNPLVLAVGGGSVIDMAKLVYYFGQTQERVQTFFESKQKPQAAALPATLVAVPTTAGTGSESTQFATLYINKIKCSLATPLVLPALAIVDPELTGSLPAQSVAESGMDALTQAVESYWSIRATDESRELARKAVKLIAPNIEAAVLEGSLSARAAMSEGSNLAGQAIHITRTTAPHAISYPMTSFFGVAHGQAVSISLPYFLVFNAGLKDTAVEKTLVEICEMLGCQSIEEAKAFWIGLMKRIGLKTTLAELGIQKQDWDVIIQHGFNPDRVKNNPRPLDEAQLRALLSEFGG